MFLSVPGGVVSARTVCALVRTYVIVGDRSCGGIKALFVCLNKYARFSLGVKAVSPGVSKRSVKGRHLELFRALRAFRSVGAKAVSQGVTHTTFLGTSRPLLAFIHKF